MLAIGAEACGQEACETELMPKRCFKASREQRQDGLRFTGEQFECRAGEELEGDERGAWIPRKAEDRLGGARAKNRGLTGLNTDTLDIEQRTEFAQSRLDQIVLAGRHAAADHEHVGGETLHEQRIESGTGIARDGKDGRFAPRPAHQRGQHVRIGVADLVRLRFFVERYDFIAGGKNGHTRTGENRNGRTACAGQSCDVARIEPGALRNQFRAGSCFGTAAVDELTRLGSAVDFDIAVHASDMLDHDNSVGTFGKRCTGHDFNRLARAECDSSMLTGSQFAADAQSAREIGSMHSETVAEGSAKSGIIAIGAKSLSQTPSISSIERNRFGCPGMRKCAHGINDDLPRFFKGQRWGSRSFAHLRILHAPGACPKGGCEQGRKTLIVRS